MSVAAVRHHPCPTSGRHRLLYATPSARRPEQSRQQTFDLGESSTRHSVFDRPAAVFDVVLLRHCPRSRGGEPAYGAEMRAGGLSVKSVIRGHRIVVRGVEVRRNQRLCGGRRAPPVYDVARADTDDPDLVVSFSGSIGADDFDDDALASLRPVDERPVGREGIPALSGYLVEDVVDHKIDEPCALLRLGLVEVIDMEYRGRSSAEVMTSEDVQANTRIAILPGRPLWSLGSFRSLWTLWSLRPFRSLWPLRSLDPLWSLGSLGPSRLGASREDREDRHHHGDRDEQPSCMHLDSLSRPAGSGPRGNDKIHDSRYVQVQRLSLDAASVNESLRLSNGILKPAGPASARNDLAFPRSRIRPAVRAVVFGRRSRRRCRAPGLRRP